MAYNKTDIRRIHSQGTAVKDRLYIDDEGNKYIGLSTGRLKVFTEGKSTTLNSDLDSTTVEQGITELISRYKQVEVDFGDALYQSYRIFEINDSDAEVGRKILAEVAYEAPTGKSLDEIEMDEFTVNAGCSEKGKINLIVKSLSGNLHDKFKINYWVL